ncbi:proline-rich protein 27 [Vicugna pacos]|uniref:Proline-rich protein 27 n=1 Tax=Vicugna pacos TaxID=30538 RepID=A0A6J3BGK2_VICPA
MKLLLWACIVSVAFARKRFYFFDENFASSSEEDYNGNFGSRYPINPSLNIPYPLPESDFAPPSSLPGNNFPRYPRNRDPDARILPNRWIFTAFGAPFYRIPNFPTPSWLLRPLPPPPPPPPPPRGDLPFLPPPSRRWGPFSPPETALPVAAEPYVAKPFVPPTPPRTVPEIEPPAVTAPDEGEPAAAAAAAGPQPSAADQVKK